MNVTVQYEAINSDFSVGTYQGYLFYDASNPTTLVGISFAYLPGYDSHAGHDAYIAAQAAAWASAHGHTITAQTWPIPLVATTLTDGLMAAGDKVNLAAAVAGMPQAMTVSSVSRTLQTSTGAVGFQPHATRNVFATYSVTVTTTATIGGAATGTVVLEVAPTNSATPGDWVELARFTNGQAISLAVVLQSVQTLAGVVSGMVPAGFYAKLRTIQVAGTPGFAYNSGREVLL